MTLMTHLSSVAHVGTSWRIHEIDGTEDMKRRLHAMGIHEGDKLTVLHALPFSGGWVVSFGPFAVAFRREEAESILVQGPLP